MTISHVQENVRLVARAPKDVQEIITNAAELSGASMSQFMIDAALDKAKEVVERSKLLMLSMEGANRFFEALDNPPEIQHLDDAYKALKGYENGTVTFERKPQSKTL
ncbi:MAG: DUF1778 domain-containing protein [Marinomonas sp.]|uniref:type II toxin-antitoxin system TacA family antitoxin n=1 Tax=Marinomonas sp. TaxID=1904862 RepID=UPI003C76580B